MLGLKRGTVKLYDHESAWETEAQQTIARLKKILGGVIKDIQHVGSTAITSIKAKPIIDIALAVDDFNDILAYEKELKDAGFYYRPGKQENLPNQLLFACGSYYDGTGEKQTHFIHVVLTDSVDWHRAAFSVSPAIKVSESTVEFAAQSFKDFLDMAQRSESIDFYRLIFSSLCLRNFGETDVCIEDLCRVMLLRLKENASPRVFAAGEWDAINGKRGKQNEASVGLNAVINSLIDIGRIKEANELYITAKKHGMKSNAYIERRLKV